jgi:hypothetical protein
MGAPLKRNRTSGIEGRINVLQDRADPRVNDPDAGAESAPPDTAVGRASSPRAVLPKLRVVARHRLTEVGDVLILRTSRSYTVYAVGAVSVSGQRDFNGSRTVTHTPDRAGAVRMAKSLLVPSGRIHLLDIDTEDWSEITD